MNMIIKDAWRLNEKLTDIARCVYYAKMGIRTPEVDAQLNRILELLEIKHPSEVGLSGIAIKSIK